MPQVHASCQSRVSIRSRRRRPGERRLGHRRRPALRFNPLPALGDREKATAIVHGVVVRRVSIRSRRSKTGRKPVAALSVRRRYWFQSAPGARRPGESVRRSTRSAESTACFNPLPALEDREKDAATVAAESAVRSFQSAPGARRPGERTAPSRSSRRFDCFNPLPALEGREKGPVVVRMLGACRRFQSAPGAEAGRKRRCRCAAGPRTTVSIRSRRRRPGERAPAVAGRLASDAFQSAPGARDREKGVRASADASSSECFNPLPALEDREKAASAAPSPALHDLFQSAPGARRPGERRPDVDVEHGPIAVSIRSRRSRTGRKPASGV